MKIQLPTFLRSALLLTLTLTGTAHSKDISYTGGLSTWADGAPFTGSVENFENGDNVTFTTGASDITLGSSVAPTQTTIETGASLDLSRADDSYTLDGNINVNTGANLTLHDELLASSATISGDGTVTIDWENSSRLDVSDELLGFTGNLVINDGNALLSSKAYDFNSITINSGGTMRLEPNTNLKDSISFSLVGGDSRNTAATISSSSSTRISAKINVSDHAIVEASYGTLTAAQGIHGSGTLYKAYNGGVFSINGNSTFTGNIVVEGGMVLFGSSNSTINSVAVAAGATARLEFNVNLDADFNLTGSMTEGGARASITSSSDAIINGLISATGNTTIGATFGTLYLKGGLTGSGNLYHNDGTTNIGTSTVLQSNSTHTGKLIIEEKMFQIGNGISSQITVDFASIDIESSGVLNINTQSEIGLEDTTINLQGGILRATDTNTVGADASTWLNIGTINVEAASSIESVFKGKYVVDTLTGSDTLSFAGTASEDFIFSIGTIKDYTGTINLGSKSTQYFEIAAINQGSGKDVVITGGVNALKATAGLVKSGEGSATIDTALEVTGGDLEMQAGTLKLNAATTLAGKVIATGTSSIELGSDSASLSIEGGNYSITGSLAQIAGSNYELTGSSISNATLTKSIITVQDNSVLQLDNVILHSSSTINLGTNSSIQVKDSQLTGLSVATTDARTFTTQQSTEAVDVQAYSITGISQLLGGSSAEGSLTLDFGVVPGFTAPTTSGLMYAFILADAGIDSMDDILASGWHGDLELIINGVRYDVLGSVTDPVTGNLLLYIPEPSTATLSLLALAGLLARRRRKNPA